jgi:hypothetical protein
MTTTELPPSAALPGVDERIFAAVVASFERAAVHLGVRLGWYRALAESAATARELAERTGTDARYAREWLEQQAVAGYLQVEDVCAEPDARRYVLAAEHRAVLVDELSLSYLPELVWQSLALTRNVERLIEVYRTGGGLSWAEMGPDARESEAALNRPYYLGPAGRWPGRRRRLWNGLERHRCGPGVSDRPRGRLRPRRALDRAGAAQRNGGRCGRPGPLLRRRRRRARRRGAPRGL